MERRKDEKVEKKRGKEKERVSGRFSHCCCEWERDVTSHFFNLVSTTTIIMTTMIGGSDVVNYDDDNRDDITVNSNRAKLDFR